jgi:hypothetical protein
LSLPVVIYAGDSKPYIHIYKSGSGCLPGPRANGHSNNILDTASMIADSSI